MESNHRRGELQSPALPTELTSLGATTRNRTPTSAVQRARACPLTLWRRDARTGEGRARNPEGIVPLACLWSVGVPGLEPGLNGPKPLALTLTRYPG